MRRTSESKMKAKSFSVEPQSVPKTATNIAGLDEVLRGGLPAERVTIINGGPGSGKTILALELLVNSAEAGKPAIFISFEETADAVRRNALALGWDLAALEKAGKLALINPQIDFDGVSAGDFDIQGLLAIVAGQAQRIGAQLVAIDAVDMLMRLFTDPTRARNQLMFLHRWLNERRLTAVMTIKAERTGQIQQEYAFLDFMADCVLVMDQRIHEQVNTRRLSVMKYRGSGYASREHPFVIAQGGLVIMPLSAVDLVQQSTGAFVSTHDPKLNEILGGGYRKSSSILLSGPSGSGKTSMAFLLTLAAAGRGEKVLFLSFEQSAKTVISEMSSIGFDLESLIGTGALRITPVMPESMGMEEHLYRFLQEIEEFQPEHIVLDGISTTSRIGSRQAALELLIRLYHAAKGRGITCIYTNQTMTTMADRLEVSGLGISSLVDTAVLLNYFRKGDQIGRSLLVLKSRGTRHSLRYHDFQITDNGLVIANSTVGD